MDYKQKYTLEAIRKVLKEKNYRFFEHGTFNLNAVWIRSKNSKSNHFDDWLFLAYKNHRNEWQTFLIPCTTDAGKHWLLNPMRKAGTAILCPSQVRGAHKLGTHRGYKAMRQIKPIPHVRDRNMDSELDFSLYKNANGETDLTLPTVIHNQVILANIHRAGANTVSRWVHKWSAGCMVIQNPKDFDFFMDCVSRQATQGHGTSLTFTLIEEQDFDHV